MERKISANLKSCFLIGCRNIRNLLSKSFELHNFCLTKVSNMKKPVLLKEVVCREFGHAYPKGYRIQREASIRLREFSWIKIYNEHIFQRYV